MDTGNIIAFLKKFSFGRLIGSGIVLRVLIAIVDGIFKITNKIPKINPNKNYKNDSLSHVAPFRILNIMVGLWDFKKPTFSFNYKF